MNGDVKSNLPTLAFNNVEQLEYFHIIILRLQQETNLYVETVSPEIILVHYMKSLSNRDKYKAFISLKMTGLTTLFLSSIK